MNGDQARVSVTVRVAPEQAFALFTEQIDRWWRRGPKYRHAGARAGLIHLEPRVGGRLFESFDGADGRPVVFEAGRVTTWEPPRRLVFSWRNAVFAPHEPSTQVEVRFEPVSAGTRVVVTHSGWAALRSDHPARHGMDAPAFSRSLGLWWGDQMSALRALTSAAAP